MPHLERECKVPEIAAAAVVRWPTAMPEVFVPVDLTVLLWWLILIIISFVVVYLYLYYNEEEGETIVRQPILTRWSGFSDFIHQFRDRVIETEYVEISPLTVGEPDEDGYILLSAVAEDVNTEYIVRQFTLANMKDTSKILDFMREYPGLYIIRISDFKDLEKLARAIKKIRRTAEIQEGAVLAVDKDYLLVSSKLDIEKKWNKHE
jgi:hypothetical protein